MVDELTQDFDTEELRRQFHVFDANGSGFIEKDELQQGLKTLGYEISDDRFEKLLEVVGSSDDRLNFDEFIALNRELFKEEMKTEFEEIDTDKSGWISKTELKEYSKKMRYGLTEEQIEDFLYQADSNENDKVGLDEYIAAIVSAWRRRTGINTSHRAAEIDTHRQTQQAASQTGKSYFVINGEMYSAKLKVDFKDMDVDGNGVVTKEDLRQKAKEIDYYLSESELEETIQGMDEDGDGRISLEEFIASAVRIKT